MFNEIESSSSKTENNVGKKFNLQYFFGIARISAGKTPEELVEEYYKKNCREKNETPVHHFSAGQYGVVPLEDLQSLCNFLQTYYQVAYDAFCTAKDKENKENASKIGLLSWLTRKENMEFISQVTLSDMTDEKTLCFKDFDALSEYLQNNMSQAKLAKANIDRKHEFEIPRGITNLDKAKYACIKGACVTIPVVAAATLLRSAMG